MAGCTRLVLDSPAGPPLRSPMPSITGLYGPPFDPTQRPDTWQVPLAAVRGEAQVLGVVCKRCQRNRRWQVDELIEQYGGKRFVGDPVEALALLALWLWR